MRWPAVALAAVFAGGAALSQTQWFAQRASRRVFLWSGFVAAAILICVGIFLTRIGSLFPAAIFSGLSWIILGVMGAGFGNQPRPLLPGDAEKQAG